MQVYFHTRSHEQYMRLFSHAKEGQILGEASTGYLYSTEAAKNIYNHNPNTKIIMMLREPVSFLHSLHMQYVNETVENEDEFETALNLETDRKNNWRSISKNVRAPSYLYYSERIKYASQISRYLDVFSPEQIMILTHEEFKSDNKEIYQRILSFLGVDRTFFPDFKVIHASKQPRFKSINKAIQNPVLKTRLQKTMGMKLYTTTHKSVNKILLKPENRTEIPPPLKRKLHQLAEEEVKKISELLGKDFYTDWGYHAPSQPTTFVH